MVNLLLEFLALCCVLAVLVEYMEIGIFIIRYTVKVSMAGINTIQGCLEKLLPPLILAIVSSSQ